MMNIGFLINPIAGMGGRVGLKGTDTPEVLQLAIQRGAEPVTKSRALKFLTTISSKPENKNIKFITPKGIMGEALFARLNKEGHNLNYDVIETIEISNTTTSQDTITIAKTLNDLNVNLIIFVGGDGTARDVLKGIGHDATTPILGIPSGVKIHSGVFALTVDKAAQILVKFANNNAELIESEIIDLDEEEFRRDRIETRIFGTALVPSVPTMIQVTKSSTMSTSSENDNIEALTKTIKTLVERNAIYILGSGSTIKRISKAFGNEVYSNKTVLGIDIVRNNIIIKKDAYEKQILEILAEFQKEKVTVILTPIGGQGFILGRGNQQISPKVIRTIGFDKFLIVSTKNKIQNLANRVLYVDTGDPSLDSELSGYKKVLVDYNEFWMMKIS